MPPHIRILGICGSLEPKSNSMRALNIALEGARASGANLCVVDLRQYQLPILNSPYQHPKSLEHLQKMKKEFQEADGIIMATPEYHGSLSGALKNALDLMGFNEFEGKMIGLIGLAGGDMGAFNALNHLRTICRQVHAWVVPSQVSIADSHLAFNAGGQIKNPKLVQRLRKLGIEVTKFALLHRQGK
mgnify:CR=1 FL=1